MNDLSQLKWEDGKLPNDPGRWAPCVKCEGGRVVMLFKLEGTNILTKVACLQCGEMYGPAGWIEAIHLAQNS